MSILIAALISFFAFAMLTFHLSPQARRRIAGYAGWVDLAVHGTVIFLFMGTSTLGLIQAEASAILFSLSLRTYRWLKGYERLAGGRWVRFPGVMT